MFALRSTRVLGTLLVLAAFSLTGCPEKELVAADPDGNLQASIRRTDYGVPHITADNLESLAFGVGYAFSQDNACMLLDIVMLYNSRRSQFFGPHQNATAQDNANLISDFGYLALEIRQQAETHFTDLSEHSQALINGYAKGFNQYLSDTGSANLDPHCAGKPWVQPIDHIDMLTVLLGTALLPGASNFLAPIFVASPPNTRFQPTPMAQHKAASGQLQALASQVTVPRHPMALNQSMASNAWAIGRERSDNGQGMLLANPHFPHTGILRMWQFHTTIPGVLNVMGASIYGTPAIVNIGFNDHVAWSHTFSTAEHFIMYELMLDDEDSSGLTYLIDGQPHTITEKTLTLDVAVAPGTVAPFSKTVYYSEYGPMVVIPDSLTWGSNAAGRNVAYSIKDANLGSLDIVDYWLAMNLARDMDDVKQAFQDFNGVIFNNTLVTDKAGNTFYIDDSTVPNLSPEAEHLLRNDPQLIATREQAGFTILPGWDSRFDYAGPVPYEQAPKLERNDFVQNSNDSFWLTNPQSPLTGYSILYGKTDYPQSPRSRMGQRLLQDSAGQDQRFSLEELERALLTTRSYLAEEMLDDLVALCQQQGADPVTVTNNQVVDVNLAPACQQLSQWDGTFHKQSKGAHIFREFAQQYSLNPQLQIPFDPENPLHTPARLDPNNEVLQQLGRAVLVLQEAGVALDAKLGDIQFVELSDVQGNPEEERLPWQGGYSVEGGFNVFHSNPNDRSLIPRHQYPQLAGSEISAVAHGYHVNYGSSWMMLVQFTPQGPQARGLMTYSQSIDPRSEHRDDQTRLYSQQPQLRPLYFHERDVASHTRSHTQVHYRKP